MVEHNSSLALQEGPGMQVRWVEVLQMLEGVTSSKSCIGFFPIPIPVPAPSFVSLVLVLVFLVNFFLPLKISSNLFRFPSPTLTDQKNLSFLALLQNSYLLYSPSYLLSEFR